MNRAGVKISPMFSIPTFMTGFARALDMGATFHEYRKPKNGRVADYEALRSDWRQVGNDIKTATEKFGNGQR